MTVDTGTIRIPLTRGYFATIDEIDRPLLDYDGWCAVTMRNVTYGVRYEYPKAFPLHREVAKRAGLAIEGMKVDHRDTDGLNCRRANLRIATHAQNSMNSNRRRDNSSGYKGVRRSSSKLHPWKAEIVVDGRSIYLGCYFVPEEAALAYAEAARKYFGEFARFDVPPGF